MSLAGHAAHRRVGASAHSLTHVQVRSLRLLGAALRWARLTGETVA
jgi:hypothetical protein